MIATIAEAARLYAEKDLAQAARVCLDLIRNDPRNFDALHLLGVICTNRGQHADSVSYLLRAAALRPNEGALVANLGNAYGAVQRFDKAVEAFQRALALHHRDASVLNNLGLSLRGAERIADAIAAFQAALQLDPGSSPALFNLARTRAEAGDFAQAEADYRRLRDQLPPDTDPGRLNSAITGLARAVLDQGRGEECLEIVRGLARQLDDQTIVQWYESLVLLLLGQFEEGWRTYESRWTAPQHDRPHPDFRVLDLNEVAGQRVLVKEEQGRGDVIQFLRYVRPLAARGARIRLSVYNDLVPLAREMEDVELVLGPDEDETEYDLLTTVMSLPLAFRTDMATIPAEVPYLRAPAARIGRMRYHLGPPSGKRVGVVWSGSAKSQPRSAIPVAKLEPLLRRSGVEFHCLQKEILPEDRAWLDRTGLVTTHDTMLRDFADTAALIEAMDLVVSIDTAVAHLAGALAKPVWIMLAFNPDWRWLLNRDDSPWYPTARLFRQPAPGDWDSVAGSVAAAFPF